MVEGVHGQSIVWDGLCRDCPNFCRINGKLCHQRQNRRSVFLDPLESAAASSLPRCTLICLCISMPVRWPKRPPNWPSRSHELTSCTSLVQWPEYYSVHVGCILSARPHSTFFCLVPTLCGLDMFRDSSCNNTAARFLIFISIPL
jgi:hypothetical protein